MVEQYLKKYTQNRLITTTETFLFFSIDRYTDIHFGLNKTLQFTKIEASYGELGF